MQSAKVHSLTETIFFWILSSFLFGMREPHRRKKRTFNSILDNPCPYFYFLRMRVCASIIQWGFSYMQFCGLTVPFKQKVASSQKRFDEWIVHFHQTQIFHYYTKLYSAIWIIIIDFLATMNFIRKLYHFLVHFKLSAIWLQKSLQIVDSKISISSNLTWINWNGSLSFGIVGIV